MEETVETSENKQNEMILTELKQQDLKEEEIKRYFF